MKNDVMIWLSAVYKQYEGGRDPAVKNVSFSVRKGEIVGLCGPSGCGKSTTLGIIAGLVMPDSGRLTINGECVLQYPPAKRDVGLLFQRPRLFGYMPVRENLELPLKLLPRKERLSHKKRSERVLDIAHLLHIEELLNVYPETLSGGQAQRVELGQALIRDVDILLFDEPFSSLDIAMKYAMSEEIAMLMKKLGKTAMLVTHDSKEASLFCDRILQMRSGEIKEVSDA